jgi:hypothetical protein
VCLVTQIIMLLSINASLKGFLRNSSNLDGVDNKNGQISCIVIIKRFNIADAENIKQSKD